MSKREKRKKNTGGKGDFNVCHRGKQRGGQAGQEEILGFGWRKLSSGEEVGVGDCMTNSITKTFVFLSYCNSIKLLNIN